MLQIVGTRTQRPIASGVKHTPVGNWQNSLGPQTGPTNPPQLWPTRAELDVLDSPIVSASAIATEIPTIFDIERLPPCPPLDGQILARIGSGLSIAAHEEHVTTSGRSQCRLLQRRQIQAFGGCTARYPGYNHACRQPPSISSPIGRSPRRARRRGGR